jgi:hypothetical protein
MAGIAQEYKTGAASAIEHTNGGIHFIASLESRLLVSSDEPL